MVKMRNSKHQYQEQFPIQSCSIPDQSWCWEPVDKEKLNKDRVETLVSEAISKDNPQIIGEYTSTSTNLYGTSIYSKEGNIEFYNGSLIGNIALKGYFIKIRDGYQIKKEKNDFEVLYLTKKDKVTDIVQIDGVKYNNLQEAIDSINGEEQKTIQLINNFELGQCICFNKNLILDLNGFTITNNYYKIETHK